MNRQTLKKESKFKLFIAVIVLLGLAYLVVDTFFMDTQRESSLSPVISSNATESGTNTTSHEVANTSVQNTVTLEKENQSSAKKVRYLEPVEYSDHLAAALAISRAANKQEATAFVENAVRLNNLRKRASILEEEKRVKSSLLEIAKLKKEARDLGIGDLEDVSVKGEEVIANTTIYTNRSEGSALGTAIDIENAAEQLSLDQMNVSLLGMSQLSKKDELTVTLQINNVRYSGVKLNQVIDHGLKVVEIQDKCIKIQMNSLTNVYCVAGV